jgi:ribosomal protein L5
MNITIVTTAKSNDDALLLLELFGMPFRAPREKKKTGAA